VQAYGETQNTQRISTTQRVAKRSSQRDRLIREHADIARRIALRMARRCPEWISREDLVSAGMVGLIEAADRYDESRQEPFISFAEHRIRGAILDELRRGDIKPRRVRQMARKITAAIRELEKTGEPATDQRVAEALDVSLDEYHAGLSQLAHVEMASLEDEQLKLIADSIAPDDQAARRETLAKIKSALDCMESRDVTILGLHYLEDMTYQEIADTLKITPSRVCQLLWRAVERLRGHLGKPMMEEAA
jgi:RNA polymerase sigma factor for flagellar operon FliA